MHAFTFVPSLRAYWHLKYKVMNPRKIFLCLRTISAEIGLIQKLWDQEKSITPTHQIFFSLGQPKSRDDLIFPAFPFFSFLFPSSLSKHSVRRT